MKEVILATAILGSNLACSTVPISYHPSSSIQMHGSLSIGDFKYLAAERKESPVPRNRITNTAIGNFNLNKDVNKLVRDAVIVELRSIGLDTKNPNLVLSGDIENFHIDDLGYRVDWTLKINYKLKDLKNDKVLYTSTKKSEFRSAKTILGLNEIIKANIESLLLDESFSRNI